MPNRILRDWTDSDSVDNLSWHAEVFFVRLIMKVDDYGRFFGSPKILKSYLFPLKDGVRDTDISRWIAECEKAGLLLVYQNERKSFLEIKKFNQRMRAERSKFPAPAINDGHMPVICQPEAGHPRTESEAKSESRGESRKSLSLGFGGVLGEGKVKINDFSLPRETEESTAVECLVEFSEDVDSRAFYQKAVKNLGPHLCREAIGEVRMRESCGSVDSRKKYLTAVLSDWMQGRGIVNELDQNIAKIR